MEWMVPGESRPYRRSHCATLHDFTTMSRSPLCNLPGTLTSRFPTAGINIDPIARAFPRQSYATRRHFRISSGDGAISGVGPRWLSMETGDVYLRLAFLQYHGCPRGGIGRAVATAGTALTVSCSITCSVV